MASPFVSDELFPVEVKYVERTLKSGMKMLMVVRDKETELRYKDNVQVIETQWKQPNWKESNEMLRRAQQTNPQTGLRELDWYAYRNLLLENYMKAWNITGDDSKSVPCTPENIARLDANLAAALVDEFLAKTTYTQEELGN